jgi:SPP1 family predicted phage head-tail adaptor
MGINAGRLRHVVEIQHAVQTQDSTTGGMVDAWQTVTGCSTVPAEIHYLSAKEFVSSNAMQSEIVARITIRNRPGLNVKMRIIGMGKTFNIHGILPDLETGKTWLTIPVSEVLETDSIDPPTLVVLTTSNGASAEILTDYTAQFTGSGGIVVTQQEFIYSGTKQDCTIIGPSFDQGGVYYFAFATYPPTMAIGFALHRSGLNSYYRVGNLITPDNTGLIEFDYDDQAQYSIAVDSNAGTYGTVWLYKNGQPVNSHILTAALAATPNTFAMYCAQIGGPAICTLVDARSNSVSGSIAWNYF